jgi:peptidyl-dipeptidase Dcp
MSDNPLLQNFDLPHQAPPFDKIKAEHFLPAVKQAIEEARGNIEAIKGAPGDANFENTIVALETASERLGTVTSIFYNLLHCNGDDALEKLAEEIGPLNANFSSDIAMDAQLFERVKAVHDKKDELSLNREELTLLEDTYIGFVRGGALLNDEDKAALREINEQMSTLGPAYNQNVKRSADDFHLWIADEKNLAGLPDTAIEAAAHAAEEKGRKGEWLFTLDFPSFQPFMTYAENRALREQIWRAFTSRAYKDQYDNCENVLKIVSLRYKRAKILGYANHAEYVLERRMAKTPGAVMGFLKKCLMTYKPAAEKDLQALKEFAKELDGREDLKPWDVGYYSEKLKHKLFDFTSEDLRPYFQLDKVLDGVFGHFSKLFGIEFKASEQYPTWNPDVKTFELFREGKFIGLLYTDFFPRKGKKPGAWKTSFRDQGLYKGKIERPVVSIVCNFTKPTPGTPSLLTFGEVETLFHEMGHAIHALLSDVTYSSHAGTNVLWDFVELPSQVQENWACTKETLDLFAEHYKTGEKIPAELVDKLNAAKNFMVGWGGLRQTGFGLLDMAWHTADPDTITDVPSFEDEATKEASLFPRLSGPFSTSFAHIFAGGYSAGYYSYKWAEVLDADTFEFFKETGLYNQDTAAKYVNEVLAKGGSEDPAILYRNFRGRDADPKALFRREGLLENENKAA